VAAVLLELGLEAREQREGIGGGAREARQDAIAVDLAYLARTGLDHRLADRHLPVARHRHLAAVANAQHGCRVKHRIYCSGVRETGSGRGWPVRDGSRLRSVANARGWAASYVFNSWAVLT